MSLLVYGEANVNGNPHGSCNVDVVILAYFHEEPKETAANPRD